MSCLQRCPRVARPLSLARWHFSIPLETHSAVKQAEECGTKLFALRKDLRLSTQSEGGLL
jgi:hypothetical protein